MADGGIHSAFLTSHYFKGHYHYSRAEYDAKFNELASEAKNKGINISLIPGFEVFLQNGIEEDIIKHKLTLGDTSYVLVETELNGLPNDFYENIFRLLRKGYKPILAHAERYVSLMNRPEKLETFIERNVYVQVNSGSLMGQYGNQVMKAAWKMVDNGWVHFLGSDDHVRGKYDSFFEARNTIQEDYDEYTADLLCNKNPKALINNEPIEYKYLVKKPIRQHTHRKRSFLEKIFG